MRAINLIVMSLSKLDAWLPTVQALGQRHIDYGMQPSHYDTVGEALLWTLEQGLGAAFTATTHDAWAEAYNTLVSVMKQPIDVRAVA